MSEDEMIATFLRAEIDSARYGEKLGGLLAGAGHDPAVLRNPDLTNVRDNAFRRALLDEHRAYGRREGLFDGFPPDVEWFRAELSQDEVLDILFIDWDWWLAISGGTRKPRDAARLIRAGQIAGVDAAGHEDVAAALDRSGQPELIAVAARAGAQLVLVEGHYRLTAYALFPEHLPDRLEVIVGLSERITGWWSY
ncbi:MAG TPA: hypothetical protein VGM80_08530 [Gaiellaceae bacterium]